ncbi:type IV pilus secretin PilQ family protein [Legionella israelensis]|uniref:Type IV pilus secretin PilQ family protein n=2 Tax=Legionella israelensis TaxID=454 RepID=A0AAX1EG13_9GAMM|nr:type IV pilus secretin PilQ family protein [Legionella israelensis]QBR84014.1 type IV pilus secretin PilQ family protein [Legionella israelensis]
MRKIFAMLIVFLAGSGMVFSKSNDLIAVKARPLPDNRVRLDFHFSRPLSQLPASFVTEKPSRLVLDFLNAGTHMDEPSRSKHIGIGSLKKYNIVSVGNRVRAVLDLSDFVSYSGNLVGNTYCLTLRGKGGLLFERNREIFVTNKPVNTRHTITHIGFRGADKKGGRVVIDLTDASVPIDVTKEGNEVIIDFHNTQIPQRLARRYDVTDFHSPAQILTARQYGKKTRVTVENKGYYDYYAYQVNKQFIVDVFPLTEEEINQAKLKKKVFTGKKISLNFQNIPVRSVLQLLADFTGINMVVSDEVKGDITLRLNEVPWDQALDIILTTQGLDKRQRGNVMLIDTKARLEQREKAELESQKELQVLAPLRSELIQIKYAKAAEIATLLKDKETSLLTERGKVSVDERTNTILIQETAVQIERIRELIAQLDVPVKQVLIEARIVNVTKDCTQDLGIRFGISRPTHLSGTLDGANQLAQGIDPADVTPLNRRLNVDLAALPVDANPASIGIALAKLGDNILLDLELSALESEGRAEIVASPRLMTTNQKSAIIESGEDIPYQEATSSGATAVAFKKAVLSLKVTPQITPDNKLVMELEINQDSDSGRRVQGVPIILTRSIETNVLVNNGQTIVLGGIYRRDKNNSITRVPFLGELPVVGNLFRSRSTSVSNEELLIFITPKIITNALSITSIEGQQHVAHSRVELDKFGKPVRTYVK